MKNVGLPVVTGIASARQNRVNNINAQQASINNLQLAERHILGEF